MPFEVRRDRRFSRKRWIGTLLLPAVILAVLFVFSHGWFSSARIVAEADSPRISLTADAPPYAFHRIASEQIEQALSDCYTEDFQTSFQAEAAYVTDSTGQVIYAHNEHVRLYPASTTKLLTAFLALSHTAELDQLVTVGELSGCYEEGSLLLYLEPGDQISMRDLLYALLLCSYNDAATAIALEVGGSLEGFAELMNQQLQAIEASDSHFVTPHGLHDANHYTSAYDLNRIMQLAYSQEILRDIMTCEEASITVYRAEDELVYTLKNTSFFLRGLYQVPEMQYVSGKTGYTSKAESCLASVFEQDGILYYSAIMKSEDASYMTAVLLDYYFAPEALPAFTAQTPLMRDIN